MITTLHVFTEEPSAKNVFEILLPKLLPENVFFRVYPHQGKQDLEKALAKTVPSISKMPGSKILITRDQDSGDCLEIKRNMDSVMTLNCSCDYYIRIVCRELEAWFLGDLHAVELAYTRFKSEQYQHKAEFRNVDQIVNPNEFLLKIIPEYSDRTTLPKLEVSETIAPFLDFDRNTSTSFNQTISAINKLIATN